MLENSFAATFSSSAVGPMYLSTDAKCFFVDIERDREVGERRR